MQNSALLSPMHYWFLVGTNVILTIYDNQVLVPYIAFACYQLFIYFNNTSVDYYCVLYFRRFVFHWDDNNDFSWTTLLNWQKLIVYKYELMEEFNNVFCIFKYKCKWLCNTIHFHLLFQLILEILNNKYLQLQCVITAHAHVMNPKWMLQYEVCLLL